MEFNLLVKVVDYAVRANMLNKATSLPMWLKNIIKKFFPKSVLEQKRWEHEYKTLIKNVKVADHITSIRLGIITDDMYRYGRFEAACLELGVPYILIDLMSNDWQQEVLSSECSAFLAYPFVMNHASKNAYDDRLKFLTDDLKKIVYPSVKSLWLWESKVRLSDWLKAHKVAHPKTSVFYKKEEAINYINRVSYPIVFKSDLGATASGVEIIHNKNRAKELISICFGNGYLRNGADKNDLQYGVVLFQEYIANTREFRLIKVNNSYFGYEKLKVGEFHSGSHSWKDMRPSDKMLTLTKDIMDIEGFSSAAIDFFQGEDGVLLVNEVQALFGMVDSFEQCVVDGISGRMVFDEVTSTWIFEAGIFCQNYLCNQRVLEVLDKLK